MRRVERRVVRRLEVRVLAGLPVHFPPRDCGIGFHSFNISPLSPPPDDTCLCFYYRSWVPSLFKTLCNISALIGLNRKLL